MAATAAVSRQQQQQQQPFSELVADVYRRRVLGHDGAGAGAGASGDVGIAVPGRLEFTVAGVDVAYVNGLRRCLLTDVRTAAFAFDPVDPAGQDVAFGRNATALHNEILGCRVGLLPLHLSRRELADFDPAEWEFTLAVRNEGDRPRDVTSADIRVRRVRDRGGDDPRRDDPRRDDPRRDDPRRGADDGRRRRRRGDEPDGQDEDAADADADAGDGDGDGDGDGISVGGGGGGGGGGRWADLADEGEWPSLPGLEGRATGGADPSSDDEDDDGDEDGGDEDGGDEDGGEDSDSTAPGARGSGATAGDSDRRSALERRWFPPDPLSGAHPIITVLMPPSAGAVQEVAFSARASVRSGSAHSRYCPVVAPAFVPVVDEARAAPLRAAAADKLRFELLEKPRAAAALADPSRPDRPAAYRFSLETACGLSAADCVLAGLEALGARLRAAADDLSDPARSPAAALPPASPDAASLRLRGQTSTLGAVLQAELLDGLDLPAPALAFLGYFQEHPLTDVLTLTGLPLRPAAAAGAGADADAATPPMLDVRDFREMLRGAAERGALKTERLADAWRRAVADAKRRDPADADADADAAAGAKTADKKNRR